MLLKVVMVAMGEVMEEVMEEEEAISKRVPV